MCFCLLVQSFPDDIPCWHLEKMIPCWSGSLWFAEQHLYPLLPRHQQLPTHLRCINQKHLQTLLKVPWSSLVYKYILFAKLSLLMKTHRCNSRVSESFPCYSISFKLAVLTTQTRQGSLYSDSPNEKLKLRKLSHMLKTWVLEPRWFSHLTRIYLSAWGSQAVSHGVGDSIFHWQHKEDKT
jgi:hypothetical protein